MKENYHVILKLVNIFQVHFPIMQSSTSENSKLKVLFNLPPELQIFLKLEIHSKSCHNPTREHDILKPKFTGTVTESKQHPFSYQ